MPFSDCSFEGLSTEGVSMAAEREERDYLTPGEVARALRVSPKTIVRWANDGRLPCTMTLGGHRRFRRADVDQLVARSESALREPAPD